jgi:hypothetical protein
MVEFHVMEQTFTELKKKRMLRELLRLIIMNDESL